jgi:hypothetical protein
MSQSESSSQQQHLCSLVSDSPLPLPKKNLSHKSSIKTTSDDNDVNNNPSNSSQPHETTNKKEDVFSDRLLAYTEKMRNLEFENSQLCSFVQSKEEYASEIKQVYEKELNEARKNVDDLANEKARFVIDLDKYASLVEEITAKNEKLEANLKTVEMEKTEYKLKCTHNFKNFYDLLENNNFFLSKYCNK